GQTTTAAMPISIALYQSNGPSIGGQHTRGSGRCVAWSACSIEPMLPPGALAVWAVLYLAHAASGGVNRRAPPRGIAMRKLLCGIVGISCAGIALVVLEGAWIAAACHRRRAREHATWI